MRVKRLIVFLILLLFISTGINETKVRTDPESSFMISSVDQDTVSQHNISSITFDHGCYLSGTSSLLDDSDQSGLKYRENITTFAGDVMNTTLETENNATSWYTSGNFAGVTATTTAPYEGSYAIEAEANGTGTAKLIYDNNTSNAWGFDATIANNYNFSIKAEIARFTLNEIRTYYTADKYGYTTPNIELGTSWQVINILVSDMTFVGVQIGDPINWVELTFTVQVGGSAKSIYYDSGGFYGSATGDIERHLDGYAKFTNIPAGYDHYTLNISAAHGINSSYQDSFFTEDATKWNDTTIVISNDPINAIEGTNAIKFVYDGLSNQSVIFDNGTGQNMQADFSDYTSHSIVLWGNTTFELAYARWFTDSDNYFYVDVAQTYTTTPTEYTVPLALYSTYGTPTRSNISWVEFGVDVLSNPDPLTIWADRFHLGTTETMRFEIDNNGEEAFLCEHTHLVGTWSSDEISLNKTKIIENGYNFTVLINDTLHAPDAFNTTLEIDYLFITMWNDTVTTTTDPGGGSGGSTTPTTTEPTDTTTFTIPTIEPGVNLVYLMLLTGAIVLVATIVVVLIRESRK